MYNLDPNMILSAMVPASTVQIDASLWLQTYFEQFGDVSPNSPLTHVSNSTKYELYNEYCADQTRMDRHFVTRQKFLSLWNSLNPHAKLRNFVSIFGKCETCQLIDSKRRATSNPIVLEA